MMPSRSGDTRVPLPDPSGPRAVFIAQSREYHTHLKKKLLQNAGACGGGSEFARRYSASVDAVVDVVFNRAAIENNAEPRKTGMAVIAMGGYGRSELAPYSDVDILILCKRKTPLVKKTASSFIRLLWDVGFELGHSMQSLVETQSVLAKNIDAKTALMESRWLCGSKELGSAVQSQISKLRREDRELFLKRKINDALKRHSKYGESYQLVEPNVKLSPGGLRDYQTLVWLSMVVLGRRPGGLESLRKIGLLLPGEAAVLRKAYEFLLRARTELHLASRSKQDHLTVKMQQMIAGRMGYGAKGDHLAVELFMKDYYMHTRSVYNITKDMIDELEGGRSVGVFIGRKKHIRKGKTLQVRLNRGKIEKDPLYIFERQKICGLKLSRSVKRRLEYALANVLKGAAYTRKMRRRFPALFQNGSNLSLVLRAMSETGFLARIIPEYERLTCLKRYDLYHHYTADEHSFRVIRNIEELAEGRKSKLTPLSRLYSEVADKRLLFLGALLHDIGKIKGRGHARKGADLSGNILKRFGLSPGDIAFTSFIIEHHLLMSHFSQRRDPTDLGTLQAFCSKVKDRTNLKFLTLITYADLKATSPVVWTRWKDNLLWGLYLKSSQFMAQKRKKPDAAYKARKRVLLQSFAPGKARQEALAHLDLLPGRYLLTMSARQVKTHLALISQLDGLRGVVSMGRKRLSTEITFCTYDKPFRLSELCGVLAINDINILFAFAFTRKDGKVIDVFQVENLMKSSPIEESRLKDIRSDLGAVLEGKMSVSKTFENRISKWKRRRNMAIPVPVRVEFDNELSTDFTIIDIFAPDGPGLLYRITSALSSEKLIIYRARISTEANRAIDAFYVQDQNGNKVKNTRRIKKIRKILESALGPLDPPR